MEEEKKAAKTAVAASIRSHRYIPATDENAKNRSRTNAGPRRSRKVVQAAAIPPPQAVPGTDPLGTNDITPGNRNHDRHPHGNPPNALVTALVTAPDTRITVETVPPEVRGLADMTGATIRAMRLQRRPEIAKTLSHAGRLARTAEGRREAVERKVLRELNDPAKA